MNSGGLHGMVRDILARRGREGGFAGGIWGSLSRLELTPLSDVDLFCVFTGQSPAGEAEALASEIAPFTDGRPVDVLACREPDALMEFALRNGIHLHALLFLHEVVGDDDVVDLLVELRRTMLTSERPRAREIVNLLGGLANMASFVMEGDHRWAKFSRIGSNRWVRLAQAAQLRWPDLISSNTADVLRVLATRLNYDANHVAAAWRETLLWRSAQEAAVLGGHESPPLTDRTALADELTAAFLQDTFPWLQETAGVPEQMLHAFLHLTTGRQGRVPAPRTVDPDTTRLLGALTSADEQTLDHLARAAAGDWWVATSIAANPAASARTLDWLVFPDIPIDRRIWQTVHLYVARNPRTSATTLRRLLATPGFRAQDYDAAAFNLSRKEPHP